MEGTATPRAVSVPSPACGGGLGRGQVAHGLASLTPSPALPRKREREREAVPESRHSPPRREPELLLRIDRSDDAQCAALAVRPAPRKREERAALAGDGVDVAADVLDARNAVRHHDLVRGLPVREVVDDMAAGHRLVLDVEMRLRRAGPVRPEERAERMIERLYV